MKLPSLTDREIVLLYQEWSEKFYAAGFMMLPEHGGLSKDFVEWASAPTNFEEYEQDLINRWRKAEGRNTNAN